MKLFQIILSRGRIHHRRFLNGRSRIGSIRSRRRVQPVTQSRLLFKVDSEFRSKFVEQKAESSAYGRRLDRFLFNSYDIRR